MLRLRQGKADHQLRAEGNRKRGGAGGKRKGAKERERGEKGHTNGDGEKAGEKEDQADGPVTRRSEQTQAGEPLNGAQKLEIKPLQ